MGFETSAFGGQTNVTDEVSNHFGARPTGVRAGSGATGKLTGTTPIGRWQRPGRHLRVSQLHASPGLHHGHVGLPAHGRSLQRLHLRCNARGSGGSTR